MTTPPLAMLAPELGRVCNPGEVARILAILGAHHCSTIGELPETPRVIVNGIVREARQRKRKPS